MLQPGYGIIPIFFVKHITICHIASNVWIWKTHLSIIFSDDVATCVHKSSQTHFVD